MWIDTLAAEPGRFSGGGCFGLRVQRKSWAYHGTQFPSADQLRVFIITG